MKMAKTALVIAAVSAISVAAGMLALPTYCDPRRSSASPAAVAPRYRMVALPVPHGYVGLTITGLNNRGQVVGSLERGGYHSRAFVWSAGRFTLLPPGKYRQDTASAINDAGIVAGQTDETTAGAITSTSTAAWVWRNGRRTYLPALSNRPDTAVTAVNEQGDVLGAAWNDWRDDLGAEVSGVTPHACLWHPGAAGSADLPVTELSNGPAVAFDALGSIYVLDTHQETFAAATAAGTPYNDSANRLLRLVCRPDHPDAIHRENLLNAVAVAVSPKNGWIVGSSFLKTTDRRGLIKSGPFVYQSGRITPLTFEPRAVNSSGWITGMISDGNRYIRAVVRVHGHLYELNRLVDKLPHGFRPVMATAINERGDIVAEILDTRRPDFEPDTTRSVLLVRR